MAAEKLQKICADVICFPTAKEIRLFSLQRNGEKKQNHSFQTYWFLLLCVGRLEVEIQALVSRGSAVGLSF